MLMHEVLAQQLLEMAKADKAMREKAIIDDSWDGSLDKKHTVTLKRLVRQHGWPTIPLVGAKASDAAWLLAQHADHDLPFQSYCLELMKGVPVHDLKQSNVAYLEDRIR